MSSLIVATTQLKKPRPNLYTSLQEASRIDLCHATAILSHEILKALFFLICTASLIERTRLAVHKQRSPETKWPPRDKGLSQQRCLPRGHFQCSLLRSGHFDYVEDKHVYYYKSPVYSDFRSTCAPEIC